MKPNYPRLAILALGLVALITLRCSKSAAPSSSTNSPTVFDVLGAPNDKTVPAIALGENSPSMVKVQNGKLFVTDSFNDRILVWNSIPTAAGTYADLVIGQKDASDIAPNGDGSTNANAYSLNESMGVAYDGTHLFASDFFNNRVLVWNNFDPASVNPSSPPGLDVHLGELRSRRVRPGDERRRPALRRGLSPRPHDRWE